jgi:ElaB/YqjD/DUF883 family membrane-anchored ribosome-binding protein
MSDMVDTGMIKRKLGELSNGFGSGARDTADEARQRIGRVYGQTRSRALDAAASTRSVIDDIAETGGQQAAQLVATSRRAVDRATVASRGLIAERPLAAVLAGVAAGVVLGFLANRLARPAADSDTPDDVDSAGA